MAKKNNAVAVVETPAANETPAVLDYLLTNYTPPKNAKRLNLPRLVKCADVPIGATVNAELVNIIDNFTGKTEMKESKVMHLRTKSGGEFLFPLSGVIRKALSTGENGKPCDPEDYIGRELFITRTPDGQSGKYKKSMFLFDVFVGDK